MLGDYLSLMGVFMLITYLYKFHGGEYDTATYLKMWPFGLLFILINEVARLYHGTMFHPGASVGPAEELRRIFYSVTSVFCGLLLFLFITKETEVYSRVVFIISWPLCILTAIIVRWSLRSIFKRYNFGNIRAIIMGAGKNGIKTAKLLKKNKYLGITPVGFVDDNQKLHGSSIEKLPVIGGLKNLKEQAEIHKVNYIIMCLPISIITDKLKELSRNFKHIMIIPGGTMFSVGWVYAYDIGGVLGLELKCNLMLKSLLLIKGIIDYSLALLVTILTIPLMIFCALIIKLSSKGAILYKAQRLGVNGKIFSIYKFRTMRIGADKYLEQYLENNPRARKEWQESFKLKRDPRITWWGNVLRKTSLDELPQLLNVLRGEMSLIGPRPIVKAERKHYGDKYEMISSVKPGITGLWQVSGRSELDYEDRVELDCYYLMNWNIWLDLFILLKTVKEVIFCTGAY